MVSHPKSLSCHLINRRFGFAMKIALIASIILVLLISILFIAFAPQELDQPALLSVEEAKAPIGTHQGSANFFIVFVGPPPNSAQVISRER